LQIAMEAPATIPGFGTVTMRMQALKIRVPFFGIYGCLIWCL
jgi:hypothetical protein